MTNPKFKVGEDVWVCPFDGTKCEAVVTDIHNDPFYGIGYKVDPSKYGDEDGEWWFERRLRKRHPPSEYKFDELMGELKKPRTKKEAKELLEEMA